MPSPTLLRSSLAELSALAAADLALLWRQVNTPDDAREALYELLPALVTTYGLAASSIAADWYDESRAEAEMPGTFRALAAEPDLRDLDVLARWGIGPLFQPEPSWDDALTLLDGGVQRRIANAARETVAVSTIQDPRADGWQRAASGGCSFCQMLAGRGVVFSKQSVDFASHDHCNCVAVPAFTGRPRPVRPYTPSERVGTAADRKRVRNYLASHDAG